MFNLTKSVNQFYDIIASLELEVTECIFLFME